MAVTIESSPLVYSPAYNPMWGVVSSTNTAQQNFEFICDVYITGVTFAGGATYLRLKSPADPVYSRGAFDVSKILQRELTSDIGNAIYGFQQCSNSLKEYTLKYGEQYGVSSGVTVYPDLAIDSARYAFNGSLEHLEYKDYTVAANVADDISVSTNVNILSNAPSSGTIRTDENAWIYILSASSGVIKYAHVNRWDAAGNGGVFHIINWNYHNTATVANRMLRFPSGYNLNSIPQGDITNGSLQSIIRSDTDKYEIFFTDSNHNRITQSYFFRVRTPCTSYAVYRLHFKNKWGGFDPFSFIRASQKSAEIKRNKFEKVIGNFKSNSSYTYNKTDKFETNFYTEYKHTIKLISDWIDENQSVWLEELLTSPEILVDDATHGLLPVNITETKYVQRKHLTDKIFNIEINFQYTFNEIRQGA